MTSLVELDASLEGDILTAQPDMRKYLSDWRGIWTGVAIGVARPKSTLDVSRIVKWCGANAVPVVPQGGNTGLSGGATPDESGKALVISLERLNRIRQFDAQANVIQVEAGLTLAGVQQAAADRGQLFPLSLAAEGTAQIGGVLATNAGGTHVFRYGSARELCLGLEFVLPNGDIWEGTNVLFKDNTGYALRQLLVGSEGTLGIITAASLKLFPKPKGAVAVLAGVASLEAACDLYAEARAHFGPELTACELVSGPCLRSVVAHMEGLRYPLEDLHLHNVLLEISSWESEARARDRAVAWLETVFEDRMLVDAIVSESLAQFDSIWGFRENISEAQSATNPVIKHDISVPLSTIARFAQECETKLCNIFNDIEVQPFGHLGDGNLHYNVVPADGLDHDDFKRRQDDINRIVHDLVNEFGGSISAEHGLGVLRRDEAARYKSATELDLLKAVKSVFDPQLIMNPGKVIAIKDA